MEPHETHAVNPCRAAAAPADKLVRVPYGQPMWALHSIAGWVLHIFETFVALTTLAIKGNRLTNLYNVTSISNYNLLGRDPFVISFDKILFCTLSTNMEGKSLLPSSNEQSLQLQEACVKLFDDYGELFKPELGRLKNFELEVHFNPEAKSIFCKPRLLPFVIQSDLSRL